MSVRIHYSAGKFRLDAEEKIRELMPHFSSVGELVQHYVTSSRKPPPSREVFVDVLDASKVHSPIVLRWPLYKRPPSLKHLSRLVINTRLRQAEMGPGTPGTPASDRRLRLGRLELPVKLIDYLDSYQLTV